MDLRDFGSTLARWWWLAVITALAAIGAGIGLYQATGATYTANSTVLLLPPKAVILNAQQNKQAYAPNNPLLYLSSLSDSRDVLVRNLSSSQVVDQLKKTAPGATTAVTTDVTSNSPLILVQSTGATEKEALSGTRAVDALVPSQLKSLQDQMSIQPLQRITSIKVTEDSKAKQSHKTALELAVVGFVGTLVLGLALIALLDALRNRRRNGAPAGTRAVDDGHGATAEPQVVQRETVQPETVVRPATQQRTQGSRPAGSKGKGGRA